MTVIHWSDFDNPGRPGPSMQTPPVEYVAPLPESTRAAARRTVAAWSTGPDDCRLLLAALDLLPAPAPPVGISQRRGGGS